MLTVATQVSARTRYVHTLCVYFALYIASLSCILYTSCHAVSLPPSSTFYRHLINATLLIFIIVRTEITHEYERSWCYY